MSDMDSEGPQNFNVDMTGAKFNVSFIYIFNHFYHVLAFRSY